MMLWEHKLWFIPMFNEVESVDALCQQLHDALASAEWTWEVVFVNDGSRDRTGAILDGLTAEVPRLRPQHHPQNRGYGAALRTGFAAATKPFGFVPYYPGPGLGGHCIPIDPFYLTWKAREYGVHTRFIELAGEVNSAMPDYVVSKVAAALNERKKAINGSKILVLGIAYKKNVDDMRESPSVFLMEKLRDLGAEVSYSDPHVPVFPKMREHHFDLASIALTAESVASYDCVLLATDHDKFDYAMLLQHAQLLVDSRGKYQQGAANVIKA